MVWNMTNAIYGADSSVANATRELMHASCGLKPTAKFSTPLRGRKMEDRRSRKDEDCLFVVKMEMACSRKNSRKKLMQASSFPRRSTSGGTKMLPCLPRLHSRTLAVVLAGFIITTPCLAQQRALTAADYARAEK